MTPTLCNRCGGHVGRCECAVLRREAYDEAAEWCRARWLDQERDVLRRGSIETALLAGGKSHGFREAAEHFRALARNPEPL